MTESWREAKVELVEMPTVRPRSRLFSVYLIPSPSLPLPRVTEHAPRALVFGSAFYNHLKPRIEPRHGMAKRDGRSSRIPKTNEHENRAAVRPSGKEPQKCPPSTTTRLESCPELSVITTNLGNDVAGPKHVEYRVASFRTLRSGRVVRLATWSVADIAAIALVGWLWRQGKARAPWTSYDSLWEQLGSYGWLLFLVLWIYSTTRQILWESITPLPGLGIQLSTTRGVRSPFFSVRIPISTSRIFVPLSDISTIIINEGLTCWSVKHYLAVVKRDGRGVVVAFDSVRPSLAVLKEVYHGVREIMWDEFGSADGV